MINAFCNEIGRSGSTKGRLRFFLIVKGLFDIEFYVVKVKIGTNLRDNLIFYPEYRFELVESRENHSQIVLSFTVHGSGRFTVKQAKVCDSSGGRAETRLSSAIKGCWE